MGDENPTLGEERIANERLPKLGIQVSPRTVRMYLRPRPPGRVRGDLRWSTFLCLHAPGMIASDFLVAVTATFRVLYIFVVIEHGSRRLVHFNITAHPTAAWIRQQVREAVGAAALVRDLCSSTRCVLSWLRKCVTTLNGKMPLDRECPVWPSGSAPPPIRYLNSSAEESTSDVTLQPRL